MEAMISKAKHDAALAEKQEQIDALRHELDQLKRMIFGTKSERIAPTPAPESEKETITYQRRKRPTKAHPGRAKLPDHLPVRQVTIEPDEDTSGMVRIGQDVARKLEFRPGTLEIVEYIRPRYARPEQDQNDDLRTIVQAAAPDQVLPKSIAGAGLLTQIMIAKYVDHLPLYRQQQMFKRDIDYEVSSSTLGDWFSSGCTLLEPLYVALIKQVLEATYLQGDESRITVLERGDDKKKDKSHRYPAKARKVHLGYMWVFRNPVAGGVLFVYRPGRGANVLNETLADFKGKLQSDGYSAYTAYLKKHEGAELVSCLAHIRRKFFDARKNDPELADQALRACWYLYYIEDKCRDRVVSPEVRQRMRRRYAEPVYEIFLNWVNENLPRSLPKSGIGKALGYAANHLPRLGHYLEDGRIEIDNNKIENKIRPLALGRKNYMFAGSRKGAERAAMMYSFLATCKEHEVNPREWLKDVLLHINDHPINKITELLPREWKKKRNGQE
ncbi:MAG: IS66 family transposase [Bacteroidota bacterium]